MYQIIKGLDNSKCEMDIILFYSFIVLSVSVIVVSSCNYVDIYFVGWK